MTFAKKCNYYKQEIQHALNNELIDCYDDDGQPIYVKAEKKETTERILDIFDEVVYQCLSAMDSARALERMYKEKTGENPDLKEYMKIVEEEHRKYNDYRYENQSNTNKIIPFRKQ